MRWLTAGVLVLALGAPAAAYGAGTEYEDVIYLKDGSIIRGTIVERVPGERYSIELFGGSVLVISAEEVKIIARETAGLSSDRARAGGFFNISKGYRPFLFGLAAAIGLIDSSNMMLYGGELFIGWRFHPIYAGGLGFGYNLAVRNRLGSPDTIYKLVPLYIHNRITYFRTDGVGLYGKFDIGYGLVYASNWPGQRGGILYGLGHGFEFGPTGFHLDIAVGLRNHYSTEFIAHFGFSM